MTGNEIADKLARSGSAQRFVVPEYSLGVCRQNARRKLERLIGKNSMWYCGVVLVVHRDRLGN
jgi:hypothetical protein